MTDLLDDERYWTTGIVLDEPAAVVTPDAERPAYDGEDDGYDYTGGAR